MSRAINFSLTEAEVTNLCTKSGVSISAIEPLPNGGCHLVCTTGEGAEQMRLRHSKHLITGRVKRFPFYHM